MILIGWAADGFPIYAKFAHRDAGDSSSELVEMTSSYQLKDGGKRPSSPDGPGGTSDGSFAKDFEYVEGSGTLDECNGREGVTPEFPDGTYYYVITEDYPFIPRYHRGTPDPSFNKGRGPGGPGGPQGGGHRGPQAGGHKRGPHGSGHRPPHHGHGPPPSRR